MRRWSLRILIALLVLLVVVIGVTQVVLSLTTIPDRIVLSQVQQQLGLRMTAASVDTGWFGNTVIRDVTLSLPLAEESLLATPELRVRHTWLPKLILTRKLVIDTLTLQDAQLVVRQDAAGRWNLQDLVELLARTGGKQQAATTSTRRSGPKLPGLILHDATLTVTDKAGRQATLAPLQFSGLPDGPLVWRYDVVVGQTVQAVGQLSPGFEWKHQVDVTLNNAGDLLRPWAGERAQPLNVAARWEGELEAGQVIGRLTLERAQAAGIDVAGVLRARAGGGMARIEPQRLLVRTPQRLLPEVQIASGAIEVTGTTVRAQRLQVSALTGMAQVDGRWQLDSDTGEVTATWDEIAQPGGVRHGGRLSASVSNTLGNRSVVADLNSSGTARGGRWRTQMKLTGGGRDWNEMNWKVAAPALSWHGPPRDVMLHGLVANLITRGKVLELTSVQLPSAERVAGTGSIDFATQAWALNLSGRGWPVPHLPESTLEFRLAGAGDFKLYRLDDLYLRTGDVEVAGKGFYDRAIPKPLDLNLTVAHAPPQGGGSDPTIQGRLKAQARLNGTAWPLDVGLTGQVLGEALRVKGRVIGDVAIDVEGSLTPAQASITSKELELLGGRWSLVGTWLKEKDLARMTVKVRDLPLAECGNAIGRSDVTGTMNGRWTFELPSFDRARLTASGEIDAYEVAVGDFEAARATGPVKMRDGRIEAGPIDLTQGKGKATANVSVALAALMKPTVGLTATKWPVDLPAAGATLAVTADTKLDLDLTTRSATGPLLAGADITLDGKPLGNARLAADLSGHQVRFKDLEANAFAGTARGNATFNLDNILATTGEMKWEDVDASAIAQVFPKLNGLSGRFGGNLKLGPSNDPRALEPVRLDVLLNSYGGSYKGAPVGDGRLTAFMNYEMGDANKPGIGDRFRIVLIDKKCTPSTEGAITVDPMNDPDGPSFIRFAEGIVCIWARFGRHRGITTPAGQVTLDLHDLNLDQLAHVVSPDAKPMPARLHGTLTVVGTPADPQRLYGEGSLQLTNADLGRAPVFDMIYSAMDRDASQGHAEVAMRLEAANLILSSIRYFSRGTEVRARGTIRELFKLPHSPIDLTAVGSVRPFSSLDLPLLADFDDVLEVVQSSVTSVVMTGTVAKHETKLVPFGDLTGEMKSFIVGDVRDQTRNR